MLKNMPMRMKQPETVSGCFSVLFQFYFRMCDGRENIYEHERVWRFTVLKIYQGRYWRPRTLLANLESQLEKMREAGEGTKKTKRRSTGRYRLTDIRRSWTLNAPLALLAFSIRHKANCVTRQARQRPHSASSLCSVNVLSSLSC